MARKFTDPGAITFSGTIRRNTDVANSSAWVAFPHDLKETFGVGNLVPYRATFDGRVTYRGSLSKMGEHGAMILLRKDVREELGKGPGDEVSVLLELDKQPREVEVPADVGHALEQAGFRERFDGLAYTHRKEFINWIEQAKRAETRARRIAGTCEMLARGQTRS